MKKQLAPSILSFDPSRYRDAVAELVATDVEWIHFDVMDGQFVPPITFGAELIRSVRSLGATPFEAHLMTREPEKHFEAFTAAGCQRIIFHAEATVHAHRLVTMLREKGVQAGVAINPATSVEAIRPILDHLDLALVMTVNPGWGGQALIPSCLDKVRELRQLRPDLEIEVDGGIDGRSIRTAAEAGANVFVAGNYLARSASIAEGVASLKSAW